METERDLVITIMRRQEHGPHKVMNLTSHLDQRDILLSRIKGKQSYFYELVFEPHKSSSSPLDSNQAVTSE